MNSRSHTFFSRQGSWLILLGSVILGLMLSGYTTMEARDKDIEKQNKRRG